MGKQAVTFWTAAMLLSLKKPMQRGWQERLCDRTLRARGGNGFFEIVPQQPTSRR